MIQSSINQIVGSFGALGGLYSKLKGTSDKKEDKNKSTEQISDNKKVQQTAPSQVPEVPKIEDKPVEPTTPPSPPVEQKMDTNVHAMDTNVQPKETPKETPKDYDSSVAQKAMDSMAKQVLAMDAQRTKFFITAENIKQKSKHNPLGMKNKIYKMSEVNK